MTARRCGCPHPLHEHGCRNRHEYQHCNCRTCVNGATAARRLRRRDPPRPPGWRPRTDLDPVIVDRLTAGLNHVTPTQAELDEAIRQLTACRLSARQIEARIPAVTNIRRVTRARARTRTTQ